MGWCIAKQITGPIGTVDSSWLDSSWPAGSNHCNKVSRNFCLPWRCCTWHWSASLHVQAHYFEPNMWLDQAKTYLVSKEISDVVDSIQDHCWPAQDTHTRSAEGTVTVNGNNRLLKDVVQPPLPKQVYAKIMLMWIGPWNVSILAFNILIKYDYWQVTRQWFMPRQSTTWTC